MIRPVQVDDAAAIAAIYNEYVLTTSITFETEEVTTDEMKKRIGSLLADGHPYFVCEEGGMVLGYAYAHPWKTRVAYAHTFETTIYIKSDQRRKGIGRQLLAQLVSTCRRNKVHALVACITLGNHASVKLHSQFGFRQVSEFPEVGFKFDQWIGVADYELLL